MNQILLIFLMLSIFTGFAHDKNETNEFNLKTISILNEHGDLVKNNALDYIAICSVTITNTETGETREVYGQGRGSTPSSAMSNCASNARATANMIVAVLNER